MISLQPLLSHVPVQTIRWLDESGQELFENVGQQQLTFITYSVGLELGNTMYTCEVTATGITTTNHHNQTQ